MRIVGCVLVCRAAADVCAVDIKELKLLGDFDHPNIVKFVRAHLLSLLCTLAERMSLAWREHPGEYS